ncbi:reverse transcriptase domain-containing protein [Tanacetum coccineum]|uniref:Reverse transcriptase domain-containing protein n=1 Tax=Tanacetum coccineum TaxID=301880 RepID=A0ABQ4ZKC7_9ASTR
MVVITNKNKELVLTRTVKGWRDGFSGYFQIPLAPKDQDKTTFACPYGTFAYRRMPFGLCNAAATFQRCMPVIFHDSCLTNLSEFLARCEETNLVLNWEKCHFMVKEGIVLGHKISKSSIKVDKAKINVIAKLPYPTNVKRDAKFVFSNQCMQAFNVLKDNLTTAPVIVAPNWNLDFELMCDASDYVVGAVLGQRIDKKFRPIYYARTKNLAFDHLSRLENPKLEKLNEEAIHNSFPDEHLMAIHVRKAENEPWKVFESGFYWPTIFKDVARYVRECNACQRAGNISSRNQMPLSNILDCLWKSMPLPIEMGHKAYWDLKNVNLDLMPHENIGRIQTLEKETRDLDVENKHKKNLKASYGVTTP